MSSLLFNSGDMLLLIEKTQWENYLFPYSQIYGRMSKAEILFIWFGGYGYGKISTDPIGTESL